MVEVQYRDRLGNNMFQYALGRIIAEELGLAFQAEPLSGFPNTAVFVGGTNHETPEQILGGHRIDLHGVLADHSPRKIILNGWFQRHEYFTPYRNRMQSWLAIDPVHHVPCNDAELVVHVRRTDYVGLGWALPFSYYEEAIERALPPSGRVSIVTDDPSDSFFLRFRRWRPTFFKGTPMQAMSYMSQAPRLIMSASTFSWWPSFLGNPEIVVCPVPSFGIWSADDGDDDIDLIEQGRFLCLKCSERYQPNVLEKLYQRGRSYRARSTRWVNKILQTDFPVQNY